MRLSFAAGLFWLSVACCAFAQVHIIRSIVQGRQRARATDVASSSRQGVELTWVILPAVALGVLLVYTWRAVQAHSVLGN